jgi:CheY-like chemotaxis protein
MPETTAPAPASQVLQPHILLVEDQERAAHGLQELLALQGFRVTCAPDGPSGLYAARSAHLDAIVLDVRLPGMDGFAVCRALREDEATRHIPIVMLTGLGDTPSKLQGFETGADDYLVKPVPARELAARPAADCHAPRNPPAAISVSVSPKSPRPCARSSALRWPPPSAPSTSPCSARGSPPMYGGTSRSAAPTSGRWRPPWPN